MYNELQKKFEDERTSKQVKYFNISRAEFFTKLIVRKLKMFIKHNCHKIMTLLNQQKLWRKI